MITILIVDDEKLERRGIRFLLKREGDFQILEAANGKDALGILASNHVDILFSDVKMPYMNGLELTKAVREDHPDMEIVISADIMIFPTRERLCDMVSWIMS